MDYIKIRGHPPWYARGTPVVNLHDVPLHQIRGKPHANGCRGPGIKIRGKPPFAIRGRPRGKLSFLTVISTTKEERSVTIQKGYSRFLTMLEMTKNTVFFRDKNGMYSQWYAFFF